MIADEVATGFGRTGTYFATNQTSMQPDIMVVGKGLTGGMMGLAATLATESLFNAFYSDDNEKAFMHGPTFMGNPLACRVALESIAVFEDENSLDKVKNIELILNEYLPQIKSNKIKDCRVKGAIGVLEVESPDSYKGLSEFVVSEGVWLRPFGNVVYLMPSYCISKTQLLEAISVIKRYFEEDH